MGRQHKNTIQKIQFCYITRETKTLKHKKQFVTKPKILFDHIYNFRIYTFLKHLHF